MIQFESFEMFEFGRPVLMWRAYVDNKATAWFPSRSHVINHIVDLGLAKSFCFDLNGSLVEA